MLTAIIITKNEATNIAACIESVLWMDEIIILDSGSTDGTEAICKKYPVKFMETDWSGFGAQKNRALQLATNEWVFSIDADERITQELQAEITKKISATDYNAYKIKRLNFFQNKAMKHCLNPEKDTPIKLFKKNAAKFSDDVVHERIIVEGKIETLDNFLLHYPFKNLEELLNKANRYSTLGAQKLAAKNAHTSIGGTLWHGFWAFFRIYFLKLGFLDGWSGFLIALGNLEGTFYRYAKLLELNKNKF